MALGLLGVLDVSIVTDRLIDLLKSYRDHSAIWPTPGSPTFNIDISGSSPDSVRSGADTVLSLYLFHIAENKNLRNSPVLPDTRVAPVPFQPMALDLYYLLTAWADKDYVHEQQALSIALKCFHENPIVRKTVTIEAQPVPEEFTLTMEVQSADEMGRFWQSTTVPARLSAVYKVSVVFITPEKVPAGAPKTRSIEIEVGTGDVAAQLPVLFGAQRTVTFVSPIAADPHVIDVAVAAPGESLTLFGSGLDQPQAKKIFFVDGITETEVTTTWHPSATDDTKSRIVVVLPAGAPPAGVYQLRVGDATFRSNSVPFSIGPRVTPPASGASPLLTPAGGVFTINGAGFLGSKTEVFVGGFALSETGGTPGAGQFAIAGGTSIAFVLPAALPNGTYGVRVRVNGIESSPAWWVTKP